MKKYLTVILSTSLSLMGCSSLDKVESNMDQANLISNFSVHKKQIQQGDVSIEFYVQGKGPVIVLLPSLSRGARDFDVVADYLAKSGFKVIRPEPRGIKGSTGPLENLTLHDFAADVALVLDAEKTGPVVVVGHAWGSQPARMLAADRPDLVRGIVMAAASAGKLPKDSTEKPYGRLRDAIDNAGNYKLPQEQRITYLKQAFFAPMNDPHVWLKGWYEKNHAAEAHARIVTPIDEYFSGGKTVPILDLQGEYDAVVVKNVMKEYLPERVVEQVIKNAGHAMVPEQPEAMANAIAKFSKQVYSAN